MKMKKNGTEKMKLESEKKERNTYLEMWTSYYYYYLTNFRSPYDGVRRSRSGIDRISK